MGQSSEMLDPNRRSERSLKELSVYIRATHTHTHLRVLVYSWLKYSEQKKETCTDYATESVSRVTLREQFLFKQRVLLVPRDNVDDSRVCSPADLRRFSPWIFHVPLDLFRSNIHLSEILRRRGEDDALASETNARWKGNAGNSLVLPKSIHEVDRFFFFTLESNSPEQASNVA